MNLGVIPSVRLSYRIGYAIDTGWLVKLHRVCPGSLKVKFPLTLFKSCISILKLKSQSLNFVYKQFIIIGTTILMMTLTSTNNLSAQKATTNASYAAGSLMDSVNHSELGQNSSLVFNKAKEEVGSTLNQLGQNMSNIGSEILNETKETAKKFGIGA